MLSCKHKRRSATGVPILSSIIKKRRGLLPTAILPRRGGHQPPSGLNTPNTIHWQQRGAPEILKDNWISHIRWLNFFNSLIFNSLQLNNNKSWIKYSYTQGVPKKYAFLWFLAITPLWKGLEIKVGGVLKNSGYSLLDWHQNFSIWPIRSWENWVQRWQPYLNNLHKNGGIFFEFQSTPYFYF